MGIEIDKAINRLKKEHKVFCSEADFQFELAFVLKKMYKKDYVVRLEYVAPIKFDDKKMHVDIFLISKNTNEIIPIELKYKTAGCDVDLDGTKYNLANHSAKDVNCYLYLKDIMRIEAIRDHYKDKFVEGYAIMLTNNVAYTKKSNDNCCFIEFSIHDDAEKFGTMNWKENASDGTKGKNNKRTTNNFIIKSSMSIHNFFKNNSSSISCSN